MKVVPSSLVEIQMRMMTDDNRRMVSAWFDSLAKWDRDAEIRKLPQPLPSHPDTYYLKIGNDLRLFFQLKADVIEVLNIVSKEAVLAFIPATPTSASSLPAEAGR